MTEHSSGDFSKRFLLFANNAACGIFQETRDAFSIVLSSDGELCMIRDCSNPQHTSTSETHLTRFIPRRYKPFAAQLLLFRNGHCSKPYCCKTFHGDNLYLGELECAWPQRSLELGDIISISNTRGDGEVYLCASNRIVRYNTTVFFPKEAVQCRGEENDLPRATCLTFTWPLCRAPADVIGLLCACITEVKQKKPLTETSKTILQPLPESKAVVLSCYPVASSIGAQHADAALSFFGDIGAELQLLQDSSRYPSTLAVVAERLDGVTYVYSGPAKAADLLHTSPLGEVFNTEDLNSARASWGVECWLPCGGPSDPPCEVDDVPGFILSLNGSVLSFLNTKSHGTRAAISRVHLTVLHSMSIVDGVSGTKGLGGIDWLVVHQAAAVRLALYHNHLMDHVLIAEKENSFSAHALGRHPEMNLTSPHVSSDHRVPRLLTDDRIGQRTALEKKANKLASISDISSSYSSGILYKRNPADFFDQYSKIRSGKPQDGVDPSWRFSFDAARGTTSACPVLESTRTADYALTVYLNGSVHGIFSDFTVVDIAPGLEVMRVIHPTGLQETLSVSRVLSEFSVRTDEEVTKIAHTPSATSGPYYEWVAMQSKVRDKLKLMLSYKRFTEMDPETRVETIHRSAGLSRIARIEVMRNDMFISLQQFS